MKTTGLDDDDDDYPDPEAPSESTPLTAQQLQHQQPGGGQPKQQQQQQQQQQHAPPDRKLSQSDADADRIGEELLSVSGEDAVHDWIKKSLNLLPPLRESRVYEEFYVGEQQDTASTSGASRTSRGGAAVGGDTRPSSGGIIGLPPVTEDEGGATTAAEGAAGVGQGDGLTEDFVSQMRRSRSASAGQQYPQTYRPPPNYGGIGAGMMASSQSVRFDGLSPYGQPGGGGSSGSLGGLRRVTTYGGGGVGIGTSVRFGHVVSSGHLRASGMGTDKIHLTPRRDSVRIPSGFYGDWGTKGRGNILVKVGCMAAIASAVLVGLLAGLFYMGEKLVGPPSQPVGAYKLVELQEGNAFWNYYNFYVGPDSIGSNGYLNYISRERAFELGIANVTIEAVPADEMAASTGIHEIESQRVSVGTDVDHIQQNVVNSSESLFTDGDSETFVYMKSAPTKEGPRDSIRLEGKRRFHRGLFILDLRHMPTGCGVWPAFWLTDEANWPVNGEIDIVEGVNFQSMAKTALHSTQVCKMDDVPMGTKTGSWDTAVGIPDKKTGVPDMTMREATNCYVYDPHQWLNQGCVAVNLEGGTLGQPLNEKGGGVYALDWDPINRHIRTFVFTPHNTVPENLVETIRTAGGPEEKRVAPDPDKWGLPYGYFAIGDATNCPASHFRNMRLVFNLAFCGSVSGNRYNMDCPKQARKFKTCNDWIKADPVELQEAYWKIRGVYVYEREWVSRWV